MSTPRVRAIFLDFDDTLCLTSQFDGPAYQMAIDVAAGEACLPALDRGALLASYKAQLKAAPFPPPGSVDIYTWRARFWADALREQGATSDDGRTDAAGARIQAAFDGARLAAMELLPGVSEMCAELRAQGRELVIITNGESRIQRDKLAAVGMSSVIPESHTIVSGEQPENKPSKSIFETALRRCAGPVTASEAIHVGDSLSADVAGANGAGLLASVWVNASGKAAPADGADAPNFVVKTVLELPAVIKAIEAGEGSL